MKYYKVVEDGYISVIGEDICGQEISEEEYQNILDAISAKPEDTENISYRLQDISLVWKAFSN
jgi:hypothetical protein